jgi:hypothetical protein
MDPEAEVSGMKVFDITRQGELNVYLRRMLRLTAGLLNKHGPFSPYVEFEHSIIYINNTSEGAYPYIDLDNFLDDVDTTMDFIDAFGGN